MTAMREAFFQRLLVPIANHDDTAATTTALRPYVEGRDCTIITVHVVEKADGALDKASVEQHEQAARDMFDRVAEDLTETDIALEMEILYGTDVAATLIDAAHELAASAILFTPRGGSRWSKLLTGDVTTTLVNESEIPIIVLPDGSGGESDE